jgi:hypothetical protein
VGGRNHGQAACGHLEVVPMLVRISSFRTTMWENAMLLFWAAKTHVLWFTNIFKE